jgi:dipeptidyl aminopeptidase/acylaminoacyl peptidase
MRIRNIFLVLFGLFVSVLSAQEKKVLSISDCDYWKSLQNSIISNNGKWICYEINPQKGDGYLYLYDVDNQRLDSVIRGKGAVFSPENDFLAFKIVPQVDSIRALKLKKTKTEKMPKDTLCVWTLSDGERKMYPRVKSFSVPLKQGGWLAAYFEKQQNINKSTDKDTTQLVLEEELERNIETKPDSTRKIKDKKFESEGTQLVYINPSAGDSVSFSQVSNFCVPRYGESLFVVESTGDSTEHSSLLRLNIDQLAIDTLFDQQGKVENLVTDEHATQLGFLFSPDTVKYKTFRLFYWQQKKNELSLVVDTMHSSLPKDWCAHAKGELWFSENGDKLFFGTGMRPQEEPEDTLLKEEKVFVDVWNWKDKRLQPMQKKNLQKEKDRAYKAVYLPLKGIVRQLETEDFDEVSVLDKGNLDYVLVNDYQPYLRASSWSADWAKDIYKLDVKTGEMELIQKRVSNGLGFSPEGNYLCWFNPSDSIWYLNNISKRTQMALTKGLKVAFYNELNDMPVAPKSYGIAGWGKDSKYVYIYDRFDIWKIDTQMKSAPVKLTSGRSASSIYRYVKLDKEQKYISEDKGLFLNTFNEITKNEGYGLLKNGKWNEFVDESVRFYSLSKAQESNILIWQKGDFNNYPELAFSELDFSNVRVISNTNPQQKSYNWGNIRLVRYNALDGESHQGLLVTPENMDKDKKYPMIVYYYERSSNRLHYYYSPRPSRSTVNWVNYASNGYVIFIPDIVYREGDPGLSAYESIMGGVMSMTQQFPFIDSENIGLQGQSWGGYQTAYMVTRTNRFKAAMAGAPVSNMTSAYGGIRWGSGMSRMFQYEHTQSRMGGTLWDKFSKYVENSPIFFVPQIETPLLIMHNDNDGAVPWYQGIELFVAMRRLDKPAWMLTYNEEEHNLTRRANSVDLSIRMMQFFDHYLKGKPAPVWMEYGIPALQKGEDMGYDLVE